VGCGGETANARRRPWHVAARLAVDRGDRVPPEVDGRDAEDTKRDAGTGLACGSAGERVPDARSRLRRRTPPCHANRPERPISAGSSAGGHPSHRAVRARGHSLRQITFSPCAAPRCRMRSSGRRSGGCVRKRRRPHDDRHRSITDQIHISIRQGHQILEKNRNE
jgi:hypothetical protein